MLGARSDLLVDRLSANAGYVGHMNDVMQEQIGTNLSAYLESVEQLGAFLRSIQGKQLSQDDVDKMRQLQGEERQAKKQFRAHWPDD